MSLRRYPTVLLCAGLSVCLLAHARTRAETAVGLAPPAISSQALSTQTTITLQGGRPMPPAPVDVAHEVAQLMARAQRQDSAAMRNQDRHPLGSSTDAAWLLGLIYVHGAGVAQDHAQAQQWFKLAAQRGHPLGTLGMSWCLLEGCQGQVLTAPALSRMSLLRSARARMIEWQAMNQRRQVSFQLTAAHRPQDPQDSLRLPDRHILVQAARAGDLHAALELGLEAIALDDAAAARSWLRSAAKAGSAAAAHNLRMLDQQSSLQSPMRSNEPAAKGHDDLLMAQRLHRGDGVLANYSEAIRLYRQAAAKGNQRAREMLALIFSRPAPPGQAIPVAWMQQLAPYSSSDAANPTPGLAPLASRVAQTPATFRREPSLLFDYLPARWQVRVTPVL